VLNQLATAICFHAICAQAVLRHLAFSRPAYISTAVLTLGFIASFPSQAAVELGISWHYVFPVMVIAYVLSRKRSATISAEDAAGLSVRVPIVAASPRVFAVSAVLYYGHAMPRGHDACGTHHPVSPAPAAAPPCICGWRFSLVALLLDLLLTIYSHHFYTVGWYLARLCGLLAGSYVLLAMMEERRDVSPPASPMPNENCTSSSTVLPMRS